MKAFTLLAALAATLLFTPATVRAESKLDEEMGVLKDAMRGLGRLGEDFAKGEKLAKDAIASIEKSKTMVPKVVKEIKDEAERKAQMDEYVKQMDALAEGFKKAEAACQAKDAAKLKEAIEALNAMKKKGHEQFTDEE